MTTLLALLGEQPIPALVPLWQYPSIEVFRLVVTEETQALAFHLMGVLDQNDQWNRVQIEPPILLDAYHLQQNHERMSAAVISGGKNNQEIWVNLTGGTKIMGFAALLAAIPNSVRCLYVSTERGTITHIEPQRGRLLREDPISVQLSVSEYLQAHQLEVSQNQAFNPDKPPESNQDKEGDPLEIFVEGCARQSGYFDDVRRRVFIRKTVKNTSVINELDVVVTKGIKLAVVSCKSGRNITNDVIYELSALSKRESAGIYCGKLLVIDQPDLPPGIKSRARAEGVRLLYGPRISQVPEVLLEILE